MHENTIAEFLAGDRPAADLHEAALTSIERVDMVRERIHVVPLGRPSSVTSEMLVRLCDATLARHLDAITLRAIAFAIVTSDDFEWSEDLVGEILHDWSSPEVNLELTSENLEQFRRWITGSEPYPAKPPAAVAAPSDLTLRSETTRVVSRA